MQQSGRCVLFILLLLIIVSLQIKSELIKIYIFVIY